MDLTLDDVKEIPLHVLDKKMHRFKEKTPGKLIIKEYPTGSAHAGHFRHLLNELRLKKNFVPDVLIVDYLNICSSSRVKGVAAANSYTLVKSIAEEIRGLAMEFNVAVLSSSQLNRSGYENSDVDLTNTSECIYIDEKVTKSNGDVIRIADLKPADVIQTNDGTKVVTMVHHPKTKKCYKITLKSGKSITVSGAHVFPTQDSNGAVDRVSIDGGLKPGYKLHSK